MDVNKIKIEADESDTWRNNQGVECQRLYVHGVGKGKYPEKATHKLENGNRRYPPGVYGIGGFIIDYGQLVVDFGKLVQLPAAK